MIYHKPVLLNECLETLKSEFGTDNEKKTLVDCNLGEAGHTFAFLSTFDTLEVVGIDRDSQIVASAKERLEPFGNRVRIVNQWSDSYLEGAEKKSVDCVFFDFGISMFHYKASKRGFSFLEDEPLDMRLDAQQALSAYDVVNFYREKELANAIYNNSGEKKSRKIAKAIADARRIKKINSTYQLKAIVDSCFSGFEKSRMEIQPSTRTFQAIRIEVNDELGRIKRSLKSAFETVKIGGIVMAITFHSLEDSIVKWTFRDHASSETGLVLTRRPIGPSDEEINENPACRSAKLRVLRRIK